MTIKNGILTKSTNSSSSLQASFDQIYTDYWDKVFRLCMGYVNDDDWAKDIAQDTFITVWQQLPKFRQEAAVGTWIFRIACNNCLRQLERSSKFVHKEVDKADESSSRVNEDEINFLYKCIATLSETDRLIISMELENVKQTEIASIMGMSESNVRVRVHRIKEKLTEKFKEYER
ncbi:RNA polymerase sigma-70 factor (ECF subfamily) [Chitinophaga dinghuensis]|uniref:RNA polymerase sigma-70 factor (ECF subfamily) n=1 Tax=Chitinophaga dinghuensis TaxID=1539050 RepID=A0A327VMA5_9BACT|nr:sigma-70 family RNA polymerase sigma factor [Chitinophaga dinghuensis]RAJ74995.1 RNA polymerase sigma-70 factor (ECF subfamily) [Chitinophaga dinghuensis]